MNKSMEKQYKIVNLGCANCAAKIENAINKDKRITSASVNYMKSSLLVSYEPEHFNDEQELYDVLNGYVSKYEHEAYLAMDAAKQSHKKETEHMQEDSCGCGCESHTQTSCGCSEEANAPHQHCGCDSHAESECATTIDPAAQEHTHAAPDSSRLGIVKTLLPWAAGIAISLIGIFLVSNQVASMALILLGYLLLGHEVLADSLKTIRRGSLFDENFLMIIATIGALYVGKYTEAIAVLLLFQIGELLQSLAVDKSKRNLADAMNLKAVSATVETPDGVKQLAPEEISVGDIIVVKPSEKIALDGIVIEGTSFLDTSSLTGESVPRKATVGDEVLSGCLNGNQTLKVKVTKPYEESTVARVLDLVENASSRKSKTENFITKFARVYTPIVVLLALAIAIVPPVISGTFDFSKYIYIACSFLVVSCPCALVISVPLGFFGGIGCASKNGIIIKGSNYLEGLTTLKTIVFDKTGTLTKGCFKVEEIKPLSSATEEEILTLAALLESYSTHPIATSIVDAYKEKFHTAIDPSKLQDYLEVAGHGVQAVIGEETYYLGNRRYMDSIGASNVPAAVDTIGTTSYLAKGQECIGYLSVADEIKEDAKPTIMALKKKGIRTVLLTGDTKAAAEKVAASLGIDTVYSELLPTDKVSKLEEVMAEQKAGETTAFVGDGINDAPVIARSDLGMAMGGVGSDAAIEAADLVLMTDEPGKIAKAIAIGRYTKKIVTINIIFSLGTKAIVLLLLALGMGSMWLAIFADVGVSLLAILNSIRTLNMKSSL